MHRGSRALRVIAKTHNRIARGVCHLELHDRGAADGDACHRDLGHECFPCRSGSGGRGGGVTRHRHHIDQILAVGTVGTVRAIRTRRTVSARRAIAASAATRKGQCQQARRGEPTPTRPKSTCT